MAGSAPTRPEEVAVQVKLTLQFAGSDLAIEGTAAGVFDPQFFRPAEDRIRYAFQEATGPEGPVLVWSGSFVNFS